MSDEKEKEIEVITLKFSVPEAARLVEILSFCNNSCKFLAMQEALKGSPAAEEKYALLSEDSNLMAEYIAASVGMGEPEGEVH